MKFKEYAQKINELAAELTDKQLEELDVYVCVRDADGIMVDTVHQAPCAGLVTDKEFTPDQCFEEGDTISAVCLN